MLGQLPAAKPCAYHASSACLPCLLSSTRVVPLLCGPQPCPQACKIGKLFAKHFKVAEQEEALRTQVCDPCLAAQPASCRPTARVDKLVCMAGSIKRCSAASRAGATAAKLSFPIT